MKRVLITFCVLVLITQILSACANQATNETYSAAIQNACFSAENDCVCFTLTKQKTVFLEKDNVVTDLYDFSYSDAFYGMKKPLIYKNKLYYVTSSRDNTECIACLRVDDFGQATVLTPQKDNIYAFTVRENTIYYYAYCSGEYVIYSYDMESTKETEVLSTDDYIYNFFISDMYLIYGNTKYDLYKKQSYHLTDELTDKDGIGLGIVDNIYYCCFKNSDMTVNEVCSVNLEDDSVKSVCKLPVGFNELRLYDNKILYVTSNENDYRYLVLGYYDLSTEETKTAFDKTSDCYRYDLLNDYIDNYDSFYYDGNFYMWYPDTVVKISSPNEAEIFGLKSYETEDGKFSYKYDWLTYEEYLEENA